MAYTNYNEIYREEFAEYVDLAECGESDDWAMWDDRNNASALLYLWKTLTNAARNRTPEDQVGLCRDAIRNLIVSAATGHAAAVADLRQEVLGTND